MRILFIFILIQISSILSAQNRLSTPMEIMAFMEASGTKYEISTLRTSITRPPKIIINHGTFVDKKQDRIFAFEYRDTETKKESEFRLKIEQILKKTNPNPEELKKYFDSILVINPANAEIKTGLADLYISENKTSQAKVLLEQAVKDNPINSRAYSLLADISEKENKIDEAVNYQILAHLYNRNDQKATDKLIRLLSQRKLVYFDNWNFSPEYIVKQKKDTIVIQANDLWLTYAFYKAVWGYEKDYQTLKKGQKVKDYLFNSEMEAVVGTFLTYSSIKTDMKQIIPEMKALELAMDNELVEEYVFYEILLPEDPLFAAHFSDDLIKRIADYILKIRTVDFSK
jgi:tetratricopeptide (TPR) repeat protein